METKNEVIEMSNGIKVSITVVDDGINTNINVSTENMEILVGSQLTHIGGRPNDR